MSSDYIPAGTPGHWVPYWNIGVPWHTDFIGLGFYAAFRRTRYDDWRLPAEHVAKLPIRYFQVNRLALSRTHYAIDKHDQKENWSADNPWYDNIFTMYGQDTSAVQPNGFRASIDPGTNRVTLNPAHNSSRLNLPFADGDEVVCSTIDMAINPVRIPIPSVMSIGVVYTMVNVSGSGDSTTFQLEDPDGNLVVFAESWTGYFGLRLQSMSQAAPAPGEDVLSDGYGPMSRALVVEAYRHRHPQATQACMDAYDFYFAAIDKWPTWAYAASA